MSGEKTGRREQMNNFVSHLVKNGTDPKFAKAKAKECAKRADRKENR